MSISLTVVGLGYAGLPVAYEACLSGLKVVGLDIDNSVVSALNDGLSHIEDIDGAQVSEMLSKGFRATTDLDCLTKSEVVVICVPTPLSEDTVPDLTAVIDAARSVGKNLASDCLVVLESTTYPGTTEDVVLPILEETSGLNAGSDFSLAYSPERVDPGNKTFGVRNTPKVVGGLTDRCTDRAVKFYSHFIDSVIPTVGMREAELAKLLENTYRHINIALMNEMAVFCHELDIDLWAAIEAAKTKPFGFEAFYPGPGVGGHCIPIDPNYLSWTVRSLGHRFRFVELAQEISGRMPEYVGRRIQELLNGIGKPVNGTTIVLLGVSYKRNIADQRGTPAGPLARFLLDMGADLYYFDPLVESFQVGEISVPSTESLSEAIQMAELLVVLQPHDEIVSSAELDDAGRILDTSGSLFGENIERL